MTPGADGFAAASNYSFEENSANDHETKMPQLPPFSRLSAALYLTVTRRFRHTLRGSKQQAWRCLHRRRVSSGLGPRFSGGGQNR